jgi:enamine deaminase RidA (YjgF/YER057c/UK114 family)
MGKGKAEEATKRGDGAARYAIGKKNPNLPFHPGVRAGDFIFVSGQVGKDADGNMVDGTIEEETQATIDAIKRILAEDGARLDDVVRVTTYLQDTRDFGRYNKVFAANFANATLARTTVEAKAVINTKIEMDAIAYKPLK